ncbi:MAG: hypothetical protein LDL51_13945 [Chloroflexi bacterium]|nr:hypothetical protein [Chloroflexota bacterium]
MTTPRDSLPKTSPYVQRKKPPERKGVDTRGMLSVVTMLFSLAAITIALFGGSKLIYDILERGMENVNNIPVKVIAISFPFVFGWVVGLVSVRGFGNAIYPPIIKIYEWGCLIAACFLYFKIIVKLFERDYTGQKFGTYILLLAGILFVLFCLHLLVEGHDLRPFAIPLIIISVVHMFIIVYNFIFNEETGGMLNLLGDFTIFLFMITASGLMLLHMGIFTRIREQIGALFLQDPANGHGN